MMETSDVLALITIFVGVTGSVVGLIKWVSGKNDQVHSRVDRKIEQVYGRVDGELGVVTTTLMQRHNDYSSSFDNLHSRINEMKDTYVKRVDLDRDLTNLYAMLNNIKEDMHSQSDAVNRRLENQTNSMNDRLDKLLDIFANKEKRG